MWICSNLTRKTPEQQPIASVSIADFEQAIVCWVRSLCQFWTNSAVALIFSPLILHRFLPTGTQVDADKPIGTHALKKSFYKKESQTNDALQMAQKDFEPIFYNTELKAKVLEKQPFLDLFQNRCS